MTSITRFAAAALLVTLAAGCGPGNGQALRASGQVEATEVRLASKVQGNVLQVAV
jgi:hypothetical protein